MQTKFTTPKQMINNLKARMDKLRSEGKEVSVDNLNAEFMENFKRRLEDNGNE